MSRLTLDRNGSEVHHYRGMVGHLCAQTLEEEVDWQQGHVTVFGKTYPEPRLTCWYGPEYTYSGKTMHGRALPYWLQMMADEYRANAVLCNKYRDGADGVSWHADDEPGTVGDIVSVSIGSTRAFKIKSLGESPQRYSFDLAHGDVLIMSPEMQKHWQHCVPKTKKPVGVRYSLTFRRMT